MCSTPYGIRGWCSRPPPRVPIVCYRAQRLTASEDGAGSYTNHCAVASSGAQRLTASEDGADDKAVRMGAWFARQCSTPYGIRGWCRRTGRRYRPYGPMCSTPYGIRGWCSSRQDGRRRNLRLCAQRLTASEDGAEADGTGASGFTFDLSKMQMF